MAPSIDPAAIRLKSAGSERMPPDPTPPLRGKPLAALRAVAANPGGLRIRAFPSVMPLLVEMGLVRMRERGKPVEP